MTENKPKKQLGLKIAAVVCLCILAYSLFCLFTATSFFPWSHEVHEPVYISASSAEEAVELFGDDLLLRQFGEIYGDREFLKYKLALKDKNATLDDRSGWTVLRASNTGPDFFYNLHINIEKPAQLPHPALSGSLDDAGKVEINGITVYYSVSEDEFPPTPEGELSAVFQRGGYWYVFHYSFYPSAEARLTTDYFDMAWQALCTLLEG